MTIAQQVEMWNKFIAMSEEYVVMLRGCGIKKWSRFASDKDRGHDRLYHIQRLEHNSSGCVWYGYDSDDNFMANDLFDYGDTADKFFDNLILYSLTRLDPQQELSTLDRGER